MAECTFSNVGSSGQVGSVHLGKLDLSGMPLLLDGIQEVVKQIENVSEMRTLDSGLAVIADQLDMINLELSKVSQISPVINVSANLPEIKIPETKIVQSMPGTLGVHFAPIIYVTLVIIAMNLTVIASCLLWKVLHP